MSIILAFAVLLGVGYMPEGGTVAVEDPVPVLSGTAPSMDLDLPGGIVYGPSFPAVYPEDLPVPTDPTSGTPSMMAPLLDHILLPREEAVIRPRDGEGYDWGYDHRIYAGTVGSGQDFDVDEVTGYLYAIIDTYHTTNDSLNVYRSTDGGVTWTWFQTATNTDGAIINPRIVLARAGGYTWVCMLGIWDESSGQDALWLRRVRTDGTNAVFEQAATDVVYADMDADVGATAWLYLTYVPDATANDIWASRNALGGAGWVSATSLFENPEMVPFPSITAGAGGRVSVALLDTRLTTNEEVRIKRSTDYAATWLGSEQVSNNSGAYGLEYTDIASGHQSTQTAWITVTFEATDDNLGYYYSTNSCQTWTYGAVFSSPGTAQNLGTIRCRKSTGAVTLAYNADPGDTTVFTYASASSPTTFSTPAAINDAAATGIWPPSAGWQGNYSAVTYSRSGGLGCFFDSFDNTGIEDATGGIATGVATLGSSPNPFSGSARINFSLTSGGPVTISVFDMGGRLVETICDGQSFPAGDNSLQWNGHADTGAPLSPGVYFCRLSASGIDVTHRMVLIR